jgi:flagellar protein FliS
MIKAYNAYFAAKTTTPKIQQVVMLYEGAIKFITQAKEAMESGDLEGVYHTLTKAGAVINGLQTSLDFRDASMEVAEVLDSFYSDVLYEINQALKCSNPENCDNAIVELRSMMEAWKQLAKGDDESTFSSTSGAMANDAPNAHSNINIQNGFGNQSGAASNQPLAISI